MRLLLDQAIKLGMVRENMARAVTVGQPKTAGTRRILSNEEAQHLLTVCHSYDKDDKEVNGCLPMVVYLGLYAGLRNEEMAWCCWDWLGERRRILTVQATSSPTGEHWKPKDADSRRMDVKDAY